MRLIMRLGSIFSLITGVMAYYPSATTSAATLDDALRSAAAPLLKSLNDNGIATVRLEARTELPDAAATPANGLLLNQIDRLLKERGIGVDQGSVAASIQCRMAITLESDQRSPFGVVSLFLFDGNGQLLDGVNDLPVDATQDLLLISNAPMFVPLTTASEQEFGVLFRRSLGKGSQTVEQGSIVHATPDCPYGMRILARNAPRPVRVDDQGSAVVDLEGLKKEENIVLELSNNSSDAVAVQILLDGVDSGAASGKTFLVHLPPSSKPIELPGGYVESKFAPDGTEILRFGVFEIVATNTESSTGVIAAVFRRSYRPGEQLSEFDRMMASGQTSKLDNPQESKALEETKTLGGLPVKYGFADHAPILGAIHAQIPVRYTKPAP